MAKKPQKKKFFDIEIPLINEKTEALAFLPEDLTNRTIKFDMTRKLRGKSLDLIFNITKEGEKLVAIPKKLVLLPYFIRHMLRKSISYVEDSIKTETKESSIILKPFLITRKKVSRAVRRTLRNSARNWIIDYAKTKTNDELFEEILSGQFQKPLSQKLKKIYPLSLCEVRILEIKKTTGKKSEEKQEEPKANSKESEASENLGALSKEAPSKEVGKKPAKEKEEKPKTKETKTKKKPAEKGK